MSVLDAKLLASSDFLMSLLFKISQLNSSVKNKSSYNTFIAGAAQYK